MEQGSDRTLETTNPPFQGGSPPQTSAPPPPSGDDAPTWRPPPAPDHPREPGIQEGLPEADFDRQETPGIDEEQNAAVAHDPPDVDLEEHAPYEIEPAEGPYSYEAEQGEEPAPYEIGGELPTAYADAPPEPAAEPAPYFEPLSAEPYAQEPAEPYLEASPDEYAEAPAGEYSDENEGSPSANGASQPSDPIGLTPPRRRGGSGRLITDHIVELGFATAEQVEEAVVRGRTAGIPAEQALINSGAINSDQLARATAERFGLDHLDLSQFDIDLGAVNLIPLHAAKRFEAVPVAFVDQGTVLVAMVDPTNVRAVDDIGIMTSMEVRPAVAAPEDIASVMARISKLDTAVAEAIEAGEEEADETPTIHTAQPAESTANAPVVKLVNGIIAQAVEEKASDVHFEPQGREIRVRYRVDGMLHDVTTIPRRMVAGVISRLKIMGNLDIAEKRLPQDGRISVMVEKHPIDIRVASLPAVNGEKIVLRLLDKEKALITLDQLGMQPETLASFSKSFRNAYGATLVTGPTGSGKTTSLYAALNIINTPEKNIVTIEDPAEYQLRGITQIQVNTRTGLTFAAGLRSIVRADPDVIMIGEIRDKETAQIAVESALTGHLVLSTMHTNDAPSAMTRLTEMGVEPFLTASAIDCVISQRLVRMLCSSCKEPVVITAEQFNESQKRLAAADFETHDELIEAFAARGCTRCSNTGYRGRVGIYEAMLVNDEIRALVIERAPADAIRSVALMHGMRTLVQDGFEKVKKGLTTIEEIARVTGSAVSAD
jgi:type IV pilus assembly protein PilB